MMIFFKDVLIDLWETHQNKQTIKEEIFKYLFLFDLIPFGDILIYEFSSILIYNSSPPCILTLSSKFLSIIKEVFLIHSREQKNTEHRKFKEFVILRRYLKNIRLGNPSHFLF